MRGLEVGPQRGSRSSKKKMEVLGWIDEVGERNVPCLL